MNLDNTTRSGVFNKNILLLATITVVLLALAYRGGLANLYVRWSTEEAYSYGFFVPLISLWLLWQRRSALLDSVGKPSWTGFLLVLLGSTFLILGELTAIFILTQYGFLISLIGLVLALGGRSLARPSILPIVFLVFAIPLPYFIDSELSWRLQILSSQLGASFLRAVNVPVYVEGNIIDLGSYKLQVVDACSGLRYLYPLLSLGFLIGYLYRSSIWKKAVVFLSAIPVTILMNSFRIAMVGVLVDHWGNGMAEGFSHYFEGWVIFMACLAILLFEAWIFERLGSGRRLVQVLGVPKIAPAVVRASSGGKFNYAFLATLIAIGLSALFVQMVGTRQEIKPPRQQFVNFPTTIGNWQASQSSLPEPIEKALKLNDYLLANYYNPKYGVVNFYVAYYASQRKGASPHSPEVCIPGGGWLITSLKEVPIKLKGQPPFKVNRTVIQRHGNHMIVYYWFDERGRQIANEYLAKWYLLVDALTRDRTDGALVRISVAQLPGEPIAEVDKRALVFMRAALPKLSPFVPK